MYCEVTSFIKQDVSVIWSHGVHDARNWCYCHCSYTLCQEKISPLSCLHYNSFVSKPILIIFGTIIQKNNYNKMCILFLSTAVLCTLTTACSTSIIFWLESRNGKRQIQSVLTWVEKSSQTTDKTVCVVTVCIQSAFHWLSQRPWTVRATGQLLCRLLTAASQTRCQSGVALNCQHQLLVFCTLFPAWYPKLCNPQDLNLQCLKARVLGQWNVVSLKPEKPLYHKHGAPVLCAVGKWMYRPALKLVPDCKW